MSLSLRLAHFIKRGGEKVALFQGSLQCKLALKNVEIDLEMVPYEKRRSIPLDVWFNFLSSFELIDAGIKLTFPSVSFTIRGGIRMMVSLAGYSHLFPIRLLHDFLRPKKCLCTSYFKRNLLYMCRWRISTCIISFYSSSKSKLDRMIG